MNGDLFFSNLNDNITYVSLVLDNDNGVRATPQHDPAVREGNKHGSSQSIILIMNKETKYYLDIRNVALVPMILSMSKPNNQTTAVLVQYFSITIVFLFLVIKRS